MQFKVQVHPDEQNFQKSDQFDGMMGQISNNDIMEGMRRVNVNERGQYKQVNEMGDDFMGGAPNGHQTTEDMREDPRRSMQKQFYMPNTHNSGHAYKPLFITNYF